MTKPKAEVVYRKLTELKKLPNNPRTIKRDDMERLKESIKNNADYFEARPLILSDRTGELTILAGNQRYEAAKMLGLTEVPTVLLSGLTEEREREIIIRDNVENGDWDMDVLANEWDAGQLTDWGVEINWETIDDMLDAVDQADVEWDDSTDYNAMNFIREAINPEIGQRVADYAESGGVLAEVLQKRAEQCTIFNFDELAKYYRSDDCSDEERELLERLYLVYVKPRKLFERAQLKFKKISGGIYDDELTTQS